MCAHPKRALLRRWTPLSPEHIQSITIRLSPPRISGRFMLRKGYIHIEQSWDNIPARHACHYEARCLPQHAYTNMPFLWLTASVVSRNL